jgi:hypothetical protein
VVVSLPEKGTVYNNIVVTNEWGRLEVDKEGRVMISDNIVLILASMSYKNNQIIGKHWVLTLEPQWEVIEYEGEYIIQKHP